MPGGIALLACLLSAGAYALVILICAAAAAALSRNQDNAGRPDYTAVRVIIIDSDDRRAQTLADPGRDERLGVGRQYVGLGGVGGPSGHRARRAEDDHQRVIAIDDTDVTPPHRAQLLYAQHADSVR